MAYIMDKKEIIYFDTLIIHTLWYELQNDYDSQIILHS